MAFSTDGLIWGISQRQDGNMKLLPGNANNEALANREKYFANKSEDHSKVVSAGLAHGDNVAVVSQRDQGGIIPNVDGLITDEKNVILSITTADCLPIFFHDPVRKVVGIAHAGWKGVALNIVGKLVEKMTIQYESDPLDVKVCVGPHIMICHFEVKEDVASQFIAYPDSIVRSQDNITIDLLSVVKEQLLAAGINPRNIAVSQDCTFCNPEKYFSFRRDKPDHVEAMIAYIGLV